MMNDFIDFSKIERISPREDSWTKVLNRLEAKERRIINFYKIFSTIPLVASFFLVSFSLYLSTVSSLKINSVSITELSNTESFSWYNSLGNSDDELEILDEQQSLTYLIKED